jgi:hypothetical protein
MLEFDCTKSITELTVRRIFSTIIVKKKTNVN